MIANYTAEGWRVITQRAHGIVAAQVGAQWRKKDRPQRWMETLLSIAEHDDAENELDGENLLTPAGGPLHFSMKTFDLSHCQRLSQATIAKSRYIALLTSMHMEFLYRDFAKDDKEAAAFLKEQSLLREQWMRELEMTQSEAERIYRLLEWCDAFSLLLCTDALQPEKRRLEISKGPDGKMYNLVQLEDELLTVEPWPFEEKSFRINLESRLIKQLSFKNSEAFRNAFLQAEVEERWFTLQGKKR